MKHLYEYINEIMDIAEVNHTELGPPCRERMIDMALYRSCVVMR